MNKRKENGKAMPIIIVVIAIILIAIGVFTYMYLKTDFLKSNETLFWKYCSKNLEMADVIKYQEDSRYVNQSYKKDATITITDETNNERVKLLNIEDLSANITTEYDSNNKRQYSKIKVNFDKESLLDLEYLRNKDIYALRSGEVANGYIGVENKNLKTLAENLKIDSSDVPNKISELDINTLLTISSEEKEHIKEIYSKVIQENVKKEKYTKTKNANIELNGNTYNTTAYTLTLNESEVKNLKIKFLETLKTDSITLNLLTTKLKTISTSEKYSTVNELTTRLEELIQEVQKTEVTDNNYITITVYAYKGKTLKTEVKVENNSIYEIIYNKEENKIIINNNLIGEEKQENLNQFKQLIISKKINSDTEETRINLINNDNQEIIVEATKQKSNSGYVLDGKIGIYGLYIIYNEKYEISSEVASKNIEDETNIVLNNLEEQKLNNLIEKLKTRINSVIQSKIERIVM